MVVVIVKRDDFFTLDCCHNHSRDPIQIYTPFLERFDPILPIQIALPPGPSPRELLPQIRMIQKDAPLFLLNMAHQYGPLATFSVGKLPVFLINHPDGVKHVLQDQNRLYSKNTIQYNSLATITGQGLLTSNGEFWLRQRRLAQGAFARSRLMQLDKIIAPAVQNMLDHWQQAANHAEAVDVDSEMMRLTLEVVGQALFSISLRGQAAELTGAVLTALDHIIYRARNIVVPPDFLPTLRNLRFRRALRTLDSAVDVIIQERRHALGQKDDLLEMFLSARDEETGAQMTDQQLRDEIITMLIAGHETVASALTWAFYLLAQNPDVRLALHAETMSASLPLKTESLSALPLSGQVFSEALRLYPPAWVISRRAEEPDEIAGYAVPAGALVIISPYVIHRHPDFWLNAETFSPARFASPTPTAHRFAYIPFGAGPRLCIGSQFATIEAQMILSLISRDFWLELAPQTHVSMDALVTLRPQGGLSMRVRQYK